ncbi:MAG: copper chaperone CopZ [Planctomycetota bacterium]
MRSALATLSGIEESDVDVDYAAKTCSVAIEDTKLTAADLVAAFEGTRFTASVAN